MDFTVLQSVYKNDKVEYLNECFQSIENSTMLPKKIILIKDGEISLEMEKLINDWKTKLPIQYEGYKENKGLAYALSYGLSFVDTEIVARMDSDDIVYEDRFEKQIRYLETNPDIDFISGYIDEFKDNPNKIISTRIVPLTHDAIKMYLKKRNAFNHMAVMFKKSAVIESGSYQTVPYFEDYDLWIRMIQKGYKAANLPDKLVKARIGNDMIGRRHGFSYAKKEIFFFKRQLESGFITKKEYRKLIFLRIPIRLFPKSILKLAYKLLRG